MIAKIQCFSLMGLKGVPVSVEVDSNNGLPSFDIVGLGDTAVKESKERVRSAIKNSGRMMPAKKITANLAPADVKKEGSAFDLPIAIGILKSSGQIACDLDGIVFLGELSLDGSIRRINGILPLIISAYSSGFTKFVVPYENSNEASYVEGTEIYGAKSLREVMDHLSNLKPIEKVSTRVFDQTSIKNIYDADFKFIKGQEVAKRALEVAVSGGHNILFVGAPGTGKTMLAKCIPTIMPDLTKEEALETTKIHSVAGMLKDSDGIVYSRPFRSPHHTSTAIAMTGGGASLKPGEISLAHNGVLFLDEMPEYQRSTLESLRQPLEDGVITISRATGSSTYPANFMMCGSMNPCPCGNYGSVDKVCTCTPSQIQKYNAKISGPLLDRIDIRVEVDSVKYSELTDTAEQEDSATIRKRVNRTREIQIKRFENEKINTNSDMGERLIAKYCPLSKECEDILKNAYESLHLSPRARSRIIKVARTIADMSMCDNIRPEHIYEAISYRHGEK